ncbi:MAG: DUF4382 domain-containing protein [Gammaproteobacteria bacterium]|nr:DUF4382 domain-containing protein [Gammaproteobacteria bacterium]
MKVNKILRMSALLASGLCIASTSYAATFAGNATPTQYLVNVSNVAFHKVGDPAGTFIPYASDAGQFDIASVPPNGNAGLLSSTGTLPSGTYDQIRFNVSKTMQLNGASNGNLGNGSPCRTVTPAVALNNPLGDNSVSVAYLGSTDGATPQLETTTVPSGSAVTLPSGYTDLGNSLQGIVPVNFTVTNDVAPTTSIKINVTNAMMFTPTGVGTCAVFPGPPSITISVA